MFITRAYLSFVALVLLQSSPVFASEIDLTFSPIKKSDKLKDRLVVNYLPSVSVNKIIQMKTGDSLLQSIFLAAPLELTIYAAQDLTQKNTNFHGRLNKDSNAAFPKKGEPLIALADAFHGTYFMSADGSLYSVPDSEKSQLITTVKPDNPKFPSTVRNTSFDFYKKHTPQEESVMLGDLEKSRPDYSIAHKYQTVIKKYNLCVTKVWKPVSNTVYGLRNTPYYELSPKNKSKLQRLETKYGNKERKKCKPERLQTARDTYYKSMVKLKSATREKLLDKVKEKYSS